ncbi:M56 family metallopeptidase [Pedobacter gandavensis]|uniref:M48 family metalloprotease n=1 Tax=Pedobacter gandavensis TaxID=2679963 RepID=A0ABR6EVJ7_9SPHI|nr:M56 family metallopeptidase [Pedobacter gandavensis]MBB2149298.1 M48 family metalloprotease [Pedobacter gandavensis]
MEAIVNNLIKATGWSIFHSLWQGAIIYGLLFLIVIAFPKLRSRLKHNLAYGAMCLIFVCFCITFFSIFKLPQENGTQQRAELMINATYYEYLNDIPQDISGRAEQLFPYLVSIYGVGLMFQLFILLAGYQKMQQLKNSVHTAVPDAWASIFQEMIGKLKLKQQIGFQLSDQVNVPLVLGYFKPIVLFPIALAAQLDLKQVEAILIHELSHIRRNDYLLNLIKTGIETILFFNPFIWLSGRFINIEREHACDDLVVQLTGTPVTYAHALLKLEILKDKSAPALSMAATGKNQHLYQRIKRITDMKTNYMNAKQQFFAITLTIVTVISLAWVKPSKAEKLTTIKAAETTDMEIAGVGFKFKKQEIEALKLAKKVTVLPIDTAKKKKTHQKVIITRNNNGHQTYYYPDSLGGGVFIADSATNASLAFLSSPEWKHQQEAIRKNAEEIRKRFDSPEWKKQQLDIQKNAEAIRKKFDSPEWKSQQQAIIASSEAIRKKFDSPEWKKQQEDIRANAEMIRKKFDSPEWKKQQEDIRANAEMIRKRFDSPEWKKQQEDIRANSEEIRKKFDSPEWKKQQEEIRANAEEIRKKFDTPEWRKKIADAKAVQSTAEYKELRRKFDQEVEVLLKKKEAEASSKAKP